ncbi:hypothetical protein niasHT_003257 [Heterodera trifolii]|uniref:B30.2/SPRY domain-containing protein n=1 Tax=Heterodera trifolii TaxID=157864 RepID=A0ABD2LR69_9BILA
MRFKSENLWMGALFLVVCHLFLNSAFKLANFRSPVAFALVFSPDHWHLAKCASKVRTFGCESPLIGTWLNALRKGALCLVVCHLFLNSAFKLANFRSPVAFAIVLTPAHWHLAKCASKPELSDWMKGQIVAKFAVKMVYELAKYEQIWKVKANPTLSYAACPFPPPLWSFSTIRLAYVRSVKANCATKGRSITARLQNRSSSTVRDVPAIIEDEDDQLRGAITNPVPSTSRAHAQIDCNAGLMRISNRLDRLSETVEALRIYQFSLLTTQKLNEWDITHCHSAIFLHDELIAEHSAQQKYFVSVRALVPARCTFGIFYFEITVLTMKSDFGIGLAPHWMGMHEIVGHTEHSFAYWSDGTIHGCCDSLPNPLDGFTQFGEADTVGCGIDLLTRAIFFTMNGTRIEGDEQ